MGEEGNVLYNRLSAPLMPALNCADFSVLHFKTLITREFKSIILQVTQQVVHTPLPSSSSPPRPLFCQRPLDGVLAVIASDFMMFYVSNSPFLIFLKTYLCLFCYFSGFIAIHLLIILLEQLLNSAASVLPSFSLQWLFRMHSHFTFLTVWYNYHSESLKSWRYSYWVVFKYFIGSKNNCFKASFLKTLKSINTSVYTLYLNCIPTLTNGKCQCVLKNYFSNIWKYEVSVDKHNIVLFFS